MVEWDGAVVLETPRLLLRTYREADLDPFAALNADPEVYRTLGGKPLSFDVRFRSRQDTRTQRLSDRNEKIRSDRLYEASLRFDRALGLERFCVSRLGQDRLQEIPDRGVLCQLAEALHHRGDLPPARQPHVPGIG